VWLTPKTVGCPAICWKQPCGTIVAAPRGGAAYAVVKTGRKEYRVHIDNIRCSDPHASKDIQRVRCEPRPAMPDGMTEQALF
jgi:hypothetical protein